MTSPKPITNTLPKASLRPNPSLEQQKKQARELLNDVKSRDHSSALRLRASLPGLSDLSDDEVFASPFKLSDAQFVIAREHGYPSWARFKSFVIAEAESFRRRRDALLTAATPALDRDHRLGSTDEAESLLSQSPELVESDIFAASALGDHLAVASILSYECGAAKQKGGPHGWEALQYLCFSRFLKAHPERTEDFLKSARLLLAGGADPNASFDAGSEHETVLYGAGGVARNAALTNLLLESGANVNDDDLEYHAAEADDDSVLMLMVDHGLDLNRTGTCLLRKLDFDEIGTVRKLLDAGADPNAGEQWGKNALHQAIMRGRTMDFIQLLIERGVNLDTRTKEGKTAFALAARSGRQDIMDLLVSCGANTDLEPIDRFLYACLSANEALVRTILAKDHALASTPGARNALSDAAGAGRTEAVRILLDVGVPITGPGDGGPTPLHQAAWGGHLETIDLLLLHGAPIDATERHYGGMAHHWAIHASVSGNNAADDRFAAVVERLMNAGAPVPEKLFGSPSVQEVLRRFGAG